MLTCLQVKPTTQTSIKIFQKTPVIYPREGDGNNSKTQCKSKSTRKMTTFDPNTLSISFLLCTTITFTLTQAATFDIRNNCSFRLWAVADPGGSKQLDNGETWTLNTNRVKGPAKIWAQTNCNSNGNGGCQNYTLPPFTLAEYSVNLLNNSDFFDISLVKGFNVPMEFSPTSDGCSKGIKCVGDINEQCPQELLDPAGCNNACTVFENDQYCCRSTKCEPTIYSEFFKGLCPDAYSNPFDNGTSTFTCPTGTNYTVVFCPTGTNDATSSNAFNVNIKNNCPYTIWPATLAGGQKPQLETTGFELGAGAMQTVNAPYSPWEGRFWARTGCTNNGGKFACTTGDCGTGQVTCDGKSGATPTTLVEIFIAANKGQDFYDVSNVDGFTISATIAPRGGTGGECKSSSCKPADLLGACPAALQLKGADGKVIGCKSACVAFGDPKYCCSGAFDTPATCPATDYSKFFSQQCPQAYSYPYDDKKGTFTCNGGPDYDITFC